MGVGVYQIDDAVMVVGVGVADSSALNNLTFGQRELYGLDALAVPVVCR